SHRRLRSALGPSWSSHESGGAWRSAQMTLGPISLAMVVASWLSPNVATETRVIVSLLLPLRAHNTGTQNETWRFHHQPALLSWAPISSEVVTTINTSGCSGSSSWKLPTSGGGLHAATTSARALVARSASTRTVRCG